MDVRITDYGFQCLFAQKNALQVKEEDKKWMGPDRKITAKTDVWSVGAIAYWLLMKQEPTTPLSGNSVAEDCQRLDAGGFSDECKDFVKSAYVFDVNQRADITKLAQLPWIASMKKGSSGGTIA